MGGACADPGSTPTAVGASDTLEVECDGETTEILTPTVRARADGVHAVVRNTSGYELLMQSDAFGDGVQPGETTLRLSILPGRSRFRCLVLSDDLDPGVEGGWASFEILPPDGWISPLVDCPGVSYQGHGDFVAGARGVADPLGDASRRFQEEGDRVVEAGYTPQEERTFLLLRGGEAVEGLVYVSDGHDGWLLQDSFGCSD